MHVQKEFDNHLDIYYVTEGSKSIYKILQWTFCLKLCIVSVKNLMN